jgi:hypothetical protein
VIAVIEIDERFPAYNVDALDQTYKYGMIASVQRMSEIAP